MHTDVALWWFVKEHYKDSVEADMIDPSEPGVLRAPPESAVVFRPHAHRCAWLS